MHYFFYNSACANPWRVNFAPTVLTNQRRAGAFAIALTLGVAASSSAVAQAAPCQATGTTAPVTGEATAAANIAASINSTISTLDTAFLAPGSAFVNSPVSKQADFTAAGTWVRGIGGKVETSSTATTSQATCSNKIRMEYGGVQVGQDLAKLNLGGSNANLHLGASAGYAEGKLTDVGTGFGGGNVQAAFVGPYSVLTYGNFVADLSARFNLYRFDVSVPNPDISNRQVDATGYSISASA
jgi:hypothetical protein